MSEVHLDSMLAQFVPQRTLRSEAATVGALLDDLERRYPRLQRRLRDETLKLRPFVKVFVNGQEIAPSDVSTIELGPKDEVDILHSIQGG